MEIITKNDRCKSELTLILKLFFTEYEISKKSFCVVHDCKITKSSYKNNVNYDTTNQDISEINNASIEAKISNVSSCESNVDNIGGGLNNIDNLSNNEDINNLEVNHTSLDAIEPTENMTDTIKNGNVIINNTNEKENNDIVQSNEIVDNKENHSEKYQSVIFETSIKFKRIFSRKTKKLNTLYDVDEKDILKYEIRFAKICLYELLSKLTHTKKPWGSLTGIRPTKLYNEYLLKTGSQKETFQIFTEDYHVSSRRTNICKNILELQKPLRAINDRFLDLYINIPFCTSKCYYCSFISVPLSECSGLVEPYVNALCKEIIETLEFIKNNNFIIKTIYVGGGTPTALSPDQLNKILQLLPKDIIEFTVEAGRPDTITKEHLDVLKTNGVTRISINPQTFNDNTLKLIGRNHTSQQVIDAFHLAKPYNFEINMDLIAGLSGETFKDFKNSLEKTISLNPNNITVHTLCYKNSSTLKTVGGDVSNENAVSNMVEYSIDELYNNGYNPYYLYRQKNSIGDYENIGYTKENSACVFNIDSMEEIASIVACGANAISKRYYSDIDRIERQANVKNLTDYITRIDEMITKKKMLFSNHEMNDEQEKNKEEENN